MILQEFIVWQGTNNIGCDSTAYLILDITNSTTSNLSVNACNSYIWNGNTYTSSGVYTWTLEQMSKAVIVQQP